jgi:hypothetical protein
MGALFYSTGVIYTLCNRIPGRLALYTHIYMAVLLTSMGTTAFVYHALEPEAKASRSCFYGAQYWTLVQVTLWSVRGLYLPYRFWGVSLAVAVLLAALIPDASRPGSDIILVAVLLSLCFAGLVYQEFARTDSSRRRVCSLCILVCCVGIWVAFRVCASDLSLFLVGQMGLGLVHVMQTFLLVAWHEFWLQQEREYLPPILSCLKGTAVTLA